jgi:hypothetical protein
MPTSQQRIGLSTSRNGGASYPAAITATAIASVPSVISGATIAQVLGQFSATQSVTIPALTAGTPKSVTFSFALKTFPNSFTLSKNAKGYVFANVVLAGSQPTDASTIIGMSALSLTFASGGTSVAGSGVWSFSNLGKYQGLAVSVTVRALSVTGTTAAQTASFLCQAQLVGVPAST